VLALAEIVGVWLSADECYHFAFVVDANLFEHSQNGIAYRSQVVFLVSKRTLLGRYGLRLNPAEGRL
jgi:hypothetical protein